MRSIISLMDAHLNRPDFVLFLDRAHGESLTYQLFIEPKGEYLQNRDRWKEDFLKQMCAEYTGPEYHGRTLIENRRYRIIGVPTFFDSNHRDEFIDTLNTTLNNAYNRSALSM